MSLCGITSSLTNLIVPPRASVVVSEARLAPPLIDQEWQPRVWCRIVTEAFVALWLFVPVIATLAVMAMQTLRPARMMSSRFIQDSFYSLIQVSTRVARPTSVLDRRAVAGLCVGAATSS
jgi:hypothetical protein